MTPDNKKHLLRTVLVVALIGIWLLFLTQPKEVVWWFWLVPIPLLLTIYEMVLRGSCCSNCRRDFGLKEVSRTPGGSLGGGRVHLVCVFCGEEGTHRIGTGH